MPLTIDLSCCNAFQRLLGANDHVATRCSRQNFDLTPRKELTRWCRWRCGSFRPTDIVEGCKYRTEARIFDLIFHPVDRGISIVGAVTRCQPRQLGKEQECGAVVSARSRPRGPVWVPVPQPWQNPCPEGGKRSLHVARDGEPLIQALCRVRHSPSGC